MVNTKYHNTANNSSSLVNTESGKGNYNTSGMNYSSGPFVSKLVETPAEPVMSANNINFDKISSTAQAAIDGKYIKISEAAKSYWTGDLVFKERGDGSILVTTQDGTPLGFVTKDSFNGVYEPTSEDTSVINEEISEPTPSAINYEYDSVINNRDLEKIDKPADDVPPTVDEMFEKATLPEEDVINENTKATISGETVQYDEHGFEKNINDTASANSKPINHYEQAPTTIKSSINDDKSMFSSGGDLKLPFYEEDIKEVYITSGYGYRKHPITGKTKFHNGVDIVAIGNDGSRNPEVCSLINGIVTYAGNKTGYGNMVEVEFIDPDGNKTTAIYAHLKSVENLEVGSFIRVGDKVGIQGSTGTSTAEHLHLEIKINDENVDPLPYISTENSFVKNEETGKNDFINVNEVTENIDNSQNNPVYNNEEKTEEEIVAEIKANNEVSSPVYEDNENKTEEVINETETKEEATEIFESPVNDSNPIEETSNGVFNGTPLSAFAPYNTDPVFGKMLTKSLGSYDYNGHHETWYAEEVLPGGGLNIPGRHVADDGTIRDSEGYICVASDLSFLPRGTTLMTSLGPAKVYDTGCAYGTIDIYVNKAKFVEYENLIRGQ